MRTAGAESRLSVRLAAIAPAAIRCSFAATDHVPKAREVTIDKGPKRRQTSACHGRSQLTDRPEGRLDVLPGEILKHLKITDADDREDHSAMEC